MSSRGVTLILSLSKDGGTTWRSSELRIKDQEMKIKKTINTGVMVALLGVCLSAFADQKPLSGLNVEEFEQKTSTTTNWGNNPFVVPLNDVAISELKLTGIVYSESNKGAIIGNQLVVIGDKIGSNEIVAIERSRVILRNENGLYSLAISGGDK